MLRCFCLAVEVSLMNFAMRLFVNFKKNIQTFKKFMFAHNMSISVKIMKIIYWTITKKPTFQTNAKVQENSLTKRNEEMIDKSDYCLFYYDENYLPPKRKWTKRDCFEYQPQPGTKLAYEYALRKKKIVYNFRW